MAHIPPPLPAAPASAPRALGAAIAVGSAVAIACAVILGVIGGVTGRQFAYGAVLLGVFVGQAVRRVRRDTHAAVAAALISLADGALPA
jgi:predicted membrane protein